MSEWSTYICDFCLFPDEYEECPMHGPAAQAYLARLVVEAWERDVKELLDER
jgi:hypothetical protein